MSRPSVVSTLHFLPCHSRCCIPNIICRCPFFWSVSGCRLGIFANLLWLFRAHTLYPVYSGVVFCSTTSCFFFNQMRCCALSRITYNWAAPAAVNILVQISGSFLIQVTKRTMTYAKCFLRFPSMCCVSWPQIFSQLFELMLIANLSTLVSLTREVITFETLRTAYSSFSDNCFPLKRALTLNTFRHLPPENMTRLGTGSPNACDSARTGLSFLRYKQFSTLHISWLPLWCGINESVHSSIQYIQAAVLFPSSSSWLLAPGDAARRAMLQSW